MVCPSRWQVIDSNLLAMQINCVLPIVVIAPSVVQDAGVNSKESIIKSGLPTPAPPRPMRTAFTNVG